MKGNISKLVREIIMLLVLFDCLISLAIFLACSITSVYFIILTNPLLFFPDSIVLLVLDLFFDISSLATFRISGGHL